jgi:hypothetical protein
MHYIVASLLSRPFSYHKDAVVTCRMRGSQEPIPLGRKDASRPRGGLMVQQCSNGEDADNANCTMTGYTFALTVFLENLSLYTVLLFCLDLGSRVDL